MKKLLFTLLNCFILFNWMQVNAQNFFNKGVNLTGWFAAGSAKSIPFTKFNKTDLENIKSLGCDVIRLPISLHYMTDGAPNYVVDPIFFNYLDQVVTWAEEVKINLIIDNHTIEDAKSKTVEAPLMKIWPQMAQHYKDRSNYIFYEILNEPNTLNTSDWAKIQQNVLNAIRKIDTKHTVIVTGADWGGIAGLLKLAVLADDNLIYSFHFYDPMLFTHQGASWTSPSQADLGNVPFPFDAARMPACPASLKGTWIESYMTSTYKNEGTVAKLKNTLDGAINYAKKNGVKIYCGELGVFNQTSPESDRVEWYKAVTGYLDEKSVPWSMWDYQGGFGLFKKGSGEMFEYDMNVQLSEGIGFTAPPQKVYSIVADTVGFNIYLDYIGENIVQGGAPGTGVVDFYSSDSYDGKYSIYTTGIPQYNAIDFDFKFTKDLSKLVSANFAVDFWVKGDAPKSDFVVRFIDTKTVDPADHPWRMDYTVNSSKVPWDGNWYPINIPLKSFRDIGSWDNSWFNSTGSFDWKAVDRFQIVSENMDFKDKQFWFDDIVVTDKEPVKVAVNTLTNNNLVKIFPNPASKSSQIQIITSETGKLMVEIYNITGQKVCTLFNNQIPRGSKSIYWNFTNVGNKLISNGIYICKISINTNVITRKISVLK